MKKKSISIRYLLATSNIIHYDILAKFDSDFLKWNSNVFGWVPHRFLNLELLWGHLSAIINFFIYMHAYDSHHFYHLISTTSTQRTNSVNHTMHLTKYITPAKCKCVLAVESIYIIWIGIQIDPLAKKFLIN